MEDGRHPIDGEAIFALVSTYETEPEGARSFEAHRKYIDVQYLLSGREIIHWAGRELGSLAIGVIRQLGFHDLSFEVVLSGSLYNGNPALVESMRSTIHGIAPGARLVRLAVPPVAGGVLLGMEQAGIQAASLRPRLIESIQKCTSLPKAGVP